MKRNNLFFPSLDSVYPFRNGNYEMRILLPEIITVYIIHTFKGHSKYCCKRSIRIYLNTIYDMLEYGQDD